MCDKLLTRAEARHLLAQAGIGIYRSRLVLIEIRPHPHGLPPRQLWLKSSVKNLIDNHLHAPQSAQVVPGEESRPAGVTTPRS
jgi:hypothetical protein